MWKHVWRAEGTVARSNARALASQLFTKPDMVLWGHRWKLSQVASILPKVTCSAIFPSPCTCHSTVPPLAHPSLPLCLCTCRFHCLEHSFPRCISSLPQVYSDILPGHPIQHLPACPVSHWPGITCDILSPCSLVPLALWSASPLRAGAYGSISGPEVRQ